MVFTCQSVKRADGIADGITGKMDINSGGRQRFMSHKRFYGKQVGSVFIQMGTKSMTKGMTGKPAFPSEPVLMGMDVS